MQPSLASAALVPLAFAFLSVPAAAQATPVVGLSPQGGSPTNLWDITVGPLAATQNGNVGFGPLSGAAFQPSSGVLFATGGNTDGGTLYLLDLAD